VGFAGANFLQGFQPVELQQLSETAWSGFPKFGCKSRRTAVIDCARATKKPGAVSARALAYFPEYAKHS
jgi:hypothetical protein